METKKDIIEQLNALTLGKAIAELDDQLDFTFVESSSFYDFISDRYDVIRGAKGTGKSALLLYAYNNKGSLEQLHDVILVKANEHSGDPAFRKAFESLRIDDPLDVYATAWRIYIINLVYEAITPYISIDSALDKYIRDKGILTKEKGFLSRLCYAVLKAKASITCNEVEYGIQIGDIAPRQIFIDFNYIFSELQKILAQEDIRVWVLLDRLDDAFPDWTEKSQLAIKSLFYVYKDLLGLKSLKLKTFIRTDIFDRITRDGFTSLSHIRPITSAPIVWDDVKMKKFILKRFEKYINISNEQDALEAVLGKQIDVGKRQPDSFGWLLNHLKDGSQIFTPRDVLEYFDNARQHTLTELDNSAITELHSKFFTKAALKKAWRTVSQSKYETQLCAENPELRDYFERFRGKKSEYNPSQLSEVLGSKYVDICSRLAYVGFLGRYGESWKIPFLYRPCLEIRQGKMQ